MESAAVAFDPDERPDDADGADEPASVLVELVTWRAKSTEAWYAPAKTFDQSVVSTLDTPFEMTAFHLARTRSPNVGGRASGLYDELNVEGRPS